jgi:GT2 family glycosyltransferase
VRSEVESGIAELVAVDNASPDDSSHIVQRELPSATLVHTGANLGFAGGVNAAWPHVSTRYWLLLNPDVVLDPGTVEALVEWMDQHLDVAIASPWLREGNHAQFPGRALPSATLSLVEALRLHRVLPRRWREKLMQGPYVLSASSDTPEPGWVPATAVIVRTDAVRAVGPLDDSFFLYGEDLEWCWRMRRGNWKIAAAPVGGGAHHPSASSRRTWDEGRVQESIAAGTLKAYRHMRGAMRARMFALVMAASLALESGHPGRSPETRERAAAACRAWWKAMLAG